MLGGDDVSGTIPDRYNFMDDRVDDRKKTIRALKILHIRQSKFQSLYDNNKHRQVKDLLDDALKERSMVWDNKMRLGIDEEPALGFPSLDEIDINVVHEAYQFLGMKYVDDTYTAPNTFALLHRTFLKIAKPDVQGKKELNLVPTDKEMKEEVKLRKEQEEMMSGKYIAPKPVNGILRNSPNPGTSSHERIQNYKNGTGRRLSPTSERMQQEINKLSLPQNSANPPRDGGDGGTPETPSAELSRKLNGSVHFDFGDESRMYETHSGDKKLEMQVDNVFAKQSGVVDNIDITAAAPIGSGFDQPGGGKRKSVRKKNRVAKPYAQEGYIQASVSCQLDIIHAKKTAARDQYVQLHMDVLRGLENEDDPGDIDEAFVKYNEKYEEYKKLLFEKFSDLPDEEQANTYIESSKISDQVTKLKIKIYRYKRQFQ